MRREQRRRRVGMPVRRVARRRLRALPHPERCDVVTAIAIATPLRPGRRRPPGDQSPGRCEPRLGWWRRLTRREDPPLKGPDHCTEGPRTPCRRSTAREEHTGQSRIGEKKGTEVGDVLGHDATAALASPREEIRVARCAERRIFGDRNHVVPTAPQLVGNDRREHLIEEQRDRRLPAHASSCWRVVQAASAVRAAASRAAISSSISSG